jgi:hypothetical protein
VTPDLVTISLGAGVQSTTLALMAAHGEFGHVDCAIFADTGWEPRDVYRQVWWLAGELPFPVYIVNNGNIRETLMRGGYADAPFFLDAPQGASMGRRQCTHQFKLRPLGWQMRELLGKNRQERIRKGAVECWVGISLDEATRMKPSGVAWRVNRWPLIEKRMTRASCLAWLERNGYPTPPKSACIGCPLHSDAGWRHLRDNDPEAWDDAITVDAAIRQTRPQYMHRSLKPLAEADIDGENRNQVDMFQNECEGHCGV